MSPPILPRTIAAIERVMAGEPISDVSRATGVDRSLIHKRLRKLGLTAPKRGRVGRPLGSPNKPKATAG